MKIEVDDFGDIVLTEVYNTVHLITSENEQISICMRDSGFEFWYEGKKYSAQKGEIKELYSIEG